jgi:O-glycosyl hydrolase
MASHVPGQFLNSTATVCPMHSPAAASDDIPDPFLRKFSLTDQGTPNVSHASYTTPAPLARVRPYPSGSRMISWLQRMQGISPNVMLFGSVWSPPLWMKNNVSNDLLPQFVQAWVAYVMLYLASYEAHGVDVAAITMQACRTSR